MPPNRPALPEFCIDDEVPNTLFVAPNDDVPKAGVAELPKAGAAAVEELPNVGATGVEELPKAGGGAPAAELLPKTTGSVF